MSTALKLDTSGSPSAAWANNAKALATWVDHYLVNRRDAYGGYYLDRKDGAVKPTTRKANDRGGPLTVARLARHFKTKGTDDVVGLHAIGFDNDGGCSSKWVGIDIDRHGDDGDEQANFQAAVAIYERADSLGFRPQLYDSNGRGGFHLVLVFSVPIPSKVAFAFGRWLVRDWRTLGLDKQPETFPKQSRIAADKYGNWLRLPGRHHKRDHYTRVWNGAGWLEGEAAIKVILATEGTSETAIPAEARPEANSDFGLDAEVERKLEQGSVVAPEAKPRRPPRADGTIEPGSDFNARASWASILTPHGWLLDHESEGVGYWTRPGKDGGQSATTNHNGADTLHVFTNAAESAFTQDGNYSKFHAHAVLNHQGDDRAATRALSAKGYGTFLAWVWDEGPWAWVATTHSNPCPKGGKVRVRKPGRRPPPVFKKPKDR